MKFDKLKRIRNEAGLTQEAFAEKLREMPAFKNVVKQTVSRWESGALKIPTYKWAQILACINRPYEPMFDGEKEEITSDEAIAALRDLVKEFSPGLGLPHCCKAGVRVGSMLGVEHRVAFNTAVKAIADKGQTVHLPSFERGWQAALDFFVSENVA